MTFSRQRVRVAYSAQYRDPVRGDVGQFLTIVQRDDEYPDWVWCIGPDGREGWVPLQFLRIDGNRAALLRGYDARELSVNAGDEVAVLEEIGGWARVTATDGRTGWVRADCLTDEPPSA